jgi:hypothetical protein
MDFGTACTIFSRIGAGEGLDGAVAQAPTIVTVIDKRTHWFAFMAVSSGYRH